MWAPPLNESAEVTQGALSLIQYSSYRTFTPFTRGMFSTRNLFKAGRGASFIPETKDDLHQTNERKNL